MARREYQAGKPTTLSAPFNIGDPSFSITSSSNWPDGAEGYNFWVTIDAGTAQEERVLCSSRTSSVVTVASGGRGADGTTESNHTQGATIWPSWSATDADEANAHVNATTAVHGLGSGVAVVGTTATQTLTNKTLTSPKINENVAVTATATEINILDGLTASTAELNLLDGVTATTTELNYVDGVTSAIQTQLNTIVNTTIPNATPVGTIVMFGGTSAPTGWLLCNGQSTASYTALAAVVGANVPDLCGRAPIGYGAGTGLTNRTTIGAKVGTETHVLTQGELPAFSHEIQMSAGGGDGTTYVRGSSGGYSTSLTYGHGSGQAHQNMQPSTVVNFIIKY